jgi:hypothetical protein
MRRIYKNANKVIVWLGDDPTAALAPHWIRVLHQYWSRRASGYGRARETILSTDESSEWLALIKLLNHPYWSRVWIIQEVSLGRRVELLYGHGVIDWNTFGPAISSFFATEKGALPMTMNTYEGSEVLPLV